MDRFAKEVMPKLIGLSWARQILLVREAIAADKSIVDGSHAFALWAANKEVWSRLEGPPMTLVDRLQAEIDQE